MKNFYKGKRIFVTGHTGFKGSWLCHVLLELGAEVVGYSLEPNTLPNLFDISGVGKDINSHIGDIRDIETLTKVFNKAKPEIVIQLAAQPLVLESYNQPRYTYETNVMGTVNVCECVRQSDSVRSFLNVTTDKVYLNRETGQDYAEDEQLNGFDPYSNSKSCSELVTSSYVNSFLKAKGVAASTARSGNVIGGGDFSENRIIPDCAKASADGKEIEIRNLTSQRPYQFVLDTLYAYLLIVQNQWGNSNTAGAYNIGPDNPTDNQTLVTKFCEAWGENAKWKHTGDPNAPHEAKLLSLNCDKIKQTLDWKPVYSIGEAVRLSAEWYKEFYNGGNANEIMQKQIKECLNACNN